MRDLAFAGVAGQAAALRSRELSAVELFEATQERIEAAQPTVNAFRRLRPERARSEAEDADRKLARGRSLPLLGVPIAIKDDVDIEGEPTAFGCPGEFPAKGADTELVRRLRAAGAVIVGKTNTPEFGQWPFTEGPAFGATRNPWSLGHTPGGSSGGAAAAVAAGLVAGAVGSDGGGSIRIPAAWTHLVGLKPQRGRVSTMPEPRSFNGLTAYGPLARDVGDAALLLDVLAGSLAGDRDRPPSPAQPFSESAAQPPRPLRIALALNIPFSGAPAHLDREVRAAVERLAARLAELGHEVEPARVRYGVAPSLSFIPRSMSGIAEWVDRAPDRSLLDRRTRGSARFGRALRPLLGLAELAEEVSRRRLGEVFRRFDLILTPSTAQHPLEIGACAGMGGWRTDEVIVAAAPYAWPWNVVGWPGISLPAGLSAAGLPIGAQLLGPANSEPLLLSLAQQLQLHERWEERRPPQGSGLGCAPAL